MTTAIDIIRLSKVRKEKKPAHNAAKPLNTYQNSNLNVVYYCPIPSCKRKALPKTRKALRQHLNRVHTARETITKEEENDYCNDFKKYEVQKKDLMDILKTGGGTATVATSAAAGVVLATVETTSTTSPATELTATIATNATTTTRTSVTSIETETPADEETDDESEESEESGEESEEEGEQTSSKAKRFKGFTGLALTFLKEYEKHLKSDYCSKESPWKEFNICMQVMMACKCSFSLQPLFQKDTFDEGFLGSFRMKQTKEGLKKKKDGSMKTYTQGFRYGDFIWGGRAAPPAAPPDIGTYGGAGPPIKLGRRGGPCF